MRSRAGWLILDNASAALFAFAFFVVTARLLPAAEFGAAALALSIAQIATPMIESLFHDALIQRDDLEERHIRTATAATLLWAVVLALLVAIAAPLAAALFDAPLLGASLPWFGIALLSSGLMAVPAALARRRMAFRLLAIRTVAARSIATAIGLAMAFSGFGIWAIVAQFTLSALLSALFLLATTAQPLRLGLERRALGELMRFAVPTMGSQLLLHANSRIVTLLVGGFMGPVAAGAWNVAMRFVEPLQTMAATTLGQFALPIYARQQGDRAELARAWAGGTRRAAFLLVPLFIGLGLCAEPVLDLFVGPRWTGVAPIMAIICLVMALIMARQLCEIIFTAIGTPRTNLAIQLQASLLSLGGVAIGASFGLLPAAIGWSLRALPFASTSVWWMRQRAGVGVAAQWHAVRGPFVAAAVMAAGLLAVQMLLPDYRSPGLRLIWLIPLGGAIYAAALLAIDPVARADAGAMRGWLRRRSIPG